jgi:hypothetical protein
VRHYTITNGHNTKIIDFKSKKTALPLTQKQKFLTDDYE